MSLPYRPIPSKLSTYTYCGDQLNTLCGAQLAWFAAAPCELLSWQDVYTCHVVQFREVKLDFKSYYMRQPIGRHSQLEWHVQEQGKWYTANTIHGEVAEEREEEKERPR